jgi:hypothetical protein
MFIPFLLLNRRRIPLDFCLIFLLLFFVMPVHAVEPSYPLVKGGVAIEIQNDYNYKSDDPGAEQNELGTQIEPFVSVFFTEAFSLNSGFTFETVTDPGPMEDRVFEDHGLFVEVLTLSYETERFGLHGGKFGPNFTIGFDAAAGVYGRDMSEDDLELAEFVGFGGSYTFSQTAFGDLTASASVFTQDRSALSNSIFTERGRVTLEDGGPGNTSGLESFAIAVNGEQIKNLGGFRYHVGFARLGVEDGSAEKRLAIAAEWLVELANGVTVIPLVEYVHFWNAGGDPLEDRNYITASLLTKYAGWNLALAFTGRDSHFSDTGTSRLDYQFQVSAGYTFKNNLSIDIGYKHARDDRIATDTIGVLLSYGHEF